MVEHHVFVWKGQYNRTVNSKREWRIAHASVYIEERKWQQTLCDSRVSGEEIHWEFPSNLGRFLPKRQDSIKL